MALEPDAVFDRFKVSLASGRVQFEGLLIYKLGSFCRNLPLSVQVATNGPQCPVTARHRTRFIPSQCGYLR
jgi:hypothetical protein